MEVSFFNIAEGTEVKNYAKKAVPRRRYFQSVEQMPILAGCGADACSVVKEIKINNPKPFGLYPSARYSPRPMGVTTKALAFKGGLTNGYNLPLMLSLGI